MVLRLLAQVVELPRLPSAERGRLCGSTAHVHAGVCEAVDPRQRAEVSRPQTGPGVTQPESRGGGRIREPTEQEPAGGWVADGAGMCPRSYRKGWGCQLGWILLVCLSRLPGAFPVRPGLTPLTF